MIKRLTFINLASFFALIFLISTVSVSFGQTSARSTTGKKSGKITICHIPPGNPDNAHTIIIDESAWDAHEAHGDSKGRCTTERDWNRKDKITICHYPPGNPDNVQSITIAIDAWEAHEAHGDAIGEDCDKPAPEPAPAPTFMSCDDLQLGQSLYNVSSSTTNGNIIHSIWMPNLFDDDKTAIFDFTQGQLVFDESSSKVWGIAELRGYHDDDDEDRSNGRSEGKDHDDEYASRYWYVNFEYNSTSIVNPKLETNQGEDLYSTWIYYVLASENSYMVSADNKDAVITFAHRGNPFQIGMGAGNKDNNEMGASAWFTWEYNNHNGYGDINVNVADLCPDDDEPVTATLETDDSEVCLGIDTSLEIEFTGEGPWTLYYQIGNETFEVTGIETATYNLPVSESGLYILTGVSDANGNQGDAVGEVLILAPPTAEFESGGYVCEGEELELKVLLGGEGPWTFTYDNGNEQNTIESSESIASVITTTPGEYRIISVTNGNCETTGSEEVVVVEQIEVGTVEISGGGDIYSGETAIITFNMTGAGPWVITYTDGTDNFTFETEETTYELEVSKAGRYSIVSAEGTACVITSGEGVVEVYELPTAELIIEDPEICADQEENLIISFTGSGPWDLTYSIDGNEIIVEDIQNADFSTKITESGEYSVVNVTDVNGRDGKTEGTFDVQVSEIPYATIDGGGSICPGEEAEITISLGGQGPWVFAYSDGNESFNVESEEPIYKFTTSDPGEYRIQTITSGSCSINIEDAVAVVEVNEVSTVELSGGGEIFAGETATLAFDMTGQGPWTIEFTNGNKTEVFTTDDTHYEIEVSEQGKYEVSSFAASGCSFETSGEVIVYELPTAELIINDPEICADQEEDLIISFTGNGPWDLIYSIDGAEQVVQDIQDANFSTKIVESGEYKVINVTDINGKDGKVNGEFDVNISEIPFATIDGGGSICPGEEAEITINLGGQGPWSFTYSDGSETFSVDSQEPQYRFRTSDPGEYRIRTITSGSCSINIEDAVAVVEVNEVSTVNLTGGGDIYEGETASLAFDMTGQGPWTIEFSNGQELKTFTTDEPHYEIEVSEQGDYEISAFSASGCSFETSGQVTVYQLSTASMTSSNQTLCDGESGQLAFNLTGNGPWDVTYSIDGTNQTITGITDQNYSVEVSEGSDFDLVRVSDTNNREGRASGSMLVDFQKLPEVTMFGGGIVCEGEQAQIRLDLTGDANLTGPWTINYTDGTQDYSVTTNDRSYNLTVGTEGVYQVRSITNGRCENGNLSSSPVTVDVIEQPTATISGTTDICPNTATSLTVDLTGEGPWTFSYTDGRNNFSVTTDDSQYMIPTSTTGNYTITNVSTQGCSNTGTGSAIIGVIKSIAIDASLVTEDTHCEGTEIYMQLNIPDGTDYDVSWSSTGDGEFSSSNNSGAIYVPSDTDEGLTFVATVSNQCETVDFSANTLVEKINSSFEISPNNADDIFTDVEYTFDASSNDGDSYSWNFGDGTSDSGSSSSHTFQESGSRSVSLTVGKGDCESTTLTEFQIVPNTNLYIPSVFNPESTNSENRSIKVYGEDVSFTGFSFEIRNRWGLVLYKTTSFEQANAVGWDGLTKGEPQENGVYTYILKGQFNNGDQFERTGTITLVK